MRTRCPLCGSVLNTWDYGDYYTPDEYGEECNNKKCIGYKKSYSYYGGHSFKVGKWEYEEDKTPSLNGSIEKEYREFELRIRYYKKHKNRRR